MKANPLSIFIGILGLLIMVTGFVFLQAGQAQTQPPPLATEGADLPARSITVSGSGEAGAPPDLAVIVLGVQTEAETAVETVSQNSERMQALIDVFRSAGIQAADLQTQTIQIWPRTSQAAASGSQPPEVIGYTARNILRVRVSNLEELGGLLDSAVAVGGNTVESISFDIVDQAAVLEQAREAAMAGARQKADQLASLAGAKLGLVLTIEETGGSNPGPLTPGRDVAESQDVPVEPGLKTVRVNVQVTWLLE
jgi:uncharacterized protein YggE